MVIAAFSLSVHSGGSLAEAVNIAKRISQPHNTSFSEILEPGISHTSSSLFKEIKDLQSSVEDALSNMADESFVSQAMSKYPQAPFSDLVSICFLFPLIFCNSFNFSCFTVSIQSYFLAADFRFTRLMG